jgi:hypothetical protein
MHIRKLLVASVALFPSACLAQYYGGGGAYSIERWDEDYSYLKDPSARTDFFDPIKYVPIGENSYLSFGGQARYRFDYFNNPSFGPGTNDEDGFHLQRYLLHADAHVGDNLRAFVQLDSSFVDGREGGGRYGDADNVDLQQAFVDLKTSDKSDPYAFLRLGRQELIYGAQRFISPDDWRNVRRSFDGGKFSLSVPNDTLDVFWVRPVVIEKERFDNDDYGASFAGIYNVTSLPNLIPSANSKLDLYALALNQTRHSTLEEPKVDADTYTLGARFHTLPKPIDFDIEGDYQFGDVETKNLSAWSIATELGYTIDPLPLTPRASLGLDMASGSADGSHRFNQLFPPTYMYLGHAYLFGRSNLIDAHLGLDFHLTKNITMYAAEHVYWRQNTNDSLYNLSGAVVRADNGSDADFVGNEFDLSLTWQIDRHLSSYVGWAHFFAGDFIQQTGAAKDVDFLYASVTYTF